MNGWIIIVLLLVLMMTGMPVSIALGLTVLTFLFTMTQVPIESVALKLFTGIEKFEIMAIPFFILAGNFLTHGGVARRMIDFASSLVGHLPGGLALAAVVACGLFAAVSGSSPATVVAIGSILLPAMVKQGFPKRYGAGVISSSGALGILIPPSIVMVMYAVSTNSSVGQLFMAGVIPGLLLVTMLGLTTWFIAWKNDYPRVIPAEGRSSLQATLSAGGGILTATVYSIIPPFALAWTFGSDDATTFWRILFASLFIWMPAGKLMLRLTDFAFGLRHEGRKVWQAYWESVWGLLLIVVVMGGIYTGVFTATEAAAMSAVYAFIVAVFVYRDMPLRKVAKVLMESANMSAMLLYIITNAVLFSFLLTSEQIPQSLADWLTHMGLGPIAFLLIVNILLLLMGNIMEPSSIILIMAPILFPVAMQLGIDPIHFGIVIVVNMEIGMITPPVGLNLYVASGIAKMGITELTVSVVPWLLTMLVFLVLITYIPAISLWLPNLLFR